MTVAQRTRNPRIPQYIGLGVVSVVLRFLGWLGIIIALVVIGIAISSLTSGVSRIHSPNESEAMRTLFQIFGGVQGLITGLTSLISAFFMVGFGEVFVALRDIARNSFLRGEQ